MKPLTDYILILWNLAITSLFDVKPILENTLILTSIVIALLRIIQLIKNFKSKK